MIKIIDGNDTGKTKKLLTECSKNNGLFVCKHPERVQDKCIAYGIPLNFYFCGYDQLKDVEKDRPIYIDEIECFVKYNIPELGGYTLTYDKE